MVSLNALRTVGERRFLRGRCGKSCGGTTGAPTHTFQTHTHSFVSHSPHLSFHACALRHHHQSTLLDKMTVSTACRRASNHSAPSGAFGLVLVVGGAMVESALAMMEFLRPLFIVTAVALVVIVVVMLIIAPRFLALSRSSSCVESRERDPSEIRFTFCAGVLTFGIY
jgi:hypothetical protein